MLHRADGREVAAHTQAWPLCSSLAQHRAQFPWSPHMRAASWKATCKSTNGPFGRSPAVGPRGFDVGETTTALCVTITGAFYIHIICSLIVQNILGNANPFSIFIALIFSIW